MRMFYIVVKGAQSQQIARRITTELNLRDPRAIMDGCDAPIKHFIATMLNVKFVDIPLDAPVGVLHGFTANDLVRQIGESFRDLYGSDVFGRLLVHRHLRETPLVTPVKYVVVYNLVHLDDIDAFDRNLIIESDDEWDLAATQNVVASIMELARK